MSVFIQCLGYIKAKLHFRELEKSQQKPVWKNGSEP